MDDNRDDLISEHTLGHSELDRGNISHQTESITSTSCSTIAGFHEDIPGNTFGKINKLGKYKAYSDFRFDIIAKVGGKAKGYLVDVFPVQYEGDDDEGPITCFFQNENPRRVVHDFMKAVNQSACGGGGNLTCSLNDSDFSAFVLEKKQKAQHLQKKTAVFNLGVQVDNMGVIIDESPWILGPSTFISQQGIEMDSSCSSFLCIPGAFKRPCSIPATFPLETRGLSKLIESLPALFRHNYCSAFLAIGSAAMVLHYRKLISKRGYCHVPVLYGISQTGKTTALRVSLSMLGCHQATYYSSGSKEAYIRKCAQSTFPVGCDDPHSEAITGQLMIELFNGAPVTLVKEELMPLTSLIVSSNFSLTQRAKHASHTVLIPFSAPEIGTQLTLEEQELWDELKGQMDSASSAIGMCIGLGAELSECGYKEIREKFVSVVQEALTDTQPRVISGYATVLWFTDKILHKCGFPTEMVKVLEHFKSEIAPNIRMLQPCEPSAMVHQNSILIDCIREVLTIVKSVENNKKLLRTFTQVDHQEIEGMRKDVLVIRYEDLPAYPGIFPKNRLVHAVTSAKAGLNNKCKGLSDGRKKAVVVFLSELPQDLQEEILNVIPDVRVKGKKGTGKAIGSRKTTNHDDQVKDETEHLSDLEIKEKKDNKEKAANNVCVKPLNPEEVSEKVVHVKGKKGIGSRKATNHDDQVNDEIEILSDPEIKGNKGKAANDVCVAKRKRKSPLQDGISNYFMPSSKKRKTVKPTYY